MHLNGCTFRIIIKMDKIALRNNFNFSDVVIDILIDRGYDTIDKITDFISENDLQSPYILPNMKEGVAKINYYVQSGESIVIYGDYDCDGIGAVVILYSALKNIGANVHYFVPQRKEDGYGISKKTLDQVYQLYQPKLIVTVDCGISSYDEINFAKREYGIEFVVTDHHELPEILPDTIIINPHLNNSDPLCGAGISLKLASALCGEGIALNYIDICAISTIADLVPLVGENRTIVKKGLRKLNKRKILPGLNALIEVSGIKGTDEITVYDVAFKIAPRLNSAGRIATAYESIKLLLSSDSDEIACLAKNLNENNKNRQDLCSTIFNDAIEQLKNYDIANKRVIVLENDNWDSGVIGIVASKLVEKFCCPAILLTKQNDILTGSCRSINGVNMYDMLTCSDEVLLGFGGHEMAAGLKIDGKNLSKFIENCTNYIKNLNVSVIPSKKYLLDASDITPKLATDLKLLEPFGINNAEPIFEIYNCSRFNRIGTLNHIKAELSKNAEIIAFNQAEKLNIFNNCVESFVVKIKRSVYKNVVKASCQLIETGKYKEEIPENIIFESICKNVISRTDLVENVVKKTFEGVGTLYITFDAKTFNELSKNVNKILCFQENYFAMDSVVLAPFDSFVYNYFNKIKFCDYVPKGLLEWLKENFGGEIEIDENMNQLPIRLDLKTLQQVYIDMLGFAGKPFYSVYETYNYLKKTVSFDEFCAGFYVLKELSIIQIIDKKLIISSNKNNRSNSYLWRCIGNE